VTLVPASVVGRGKICALDVLAAKELPKIVINDPGATGCLKLAAFTTAVPEAVGLDVTNSNRALRAR
jgi:hypothetical protein